jgi:hypothetical protein
VPMEERGSAVAVRGEEGVRRGPFIVAGKVVTSLNLRVCKN